MTRSRHPGVCAGPSCGVCNSMERFRPLTPVQLDAEVDQGAMAVRAHLQRFIGEYREMAAGKGDLEAQLEFCWKMGSLTVPALAVLLTQAVRRLAQAQP